MENAAFVSVNGQPVLPERAADASEEDPAALLRQLRRFHLRAGPAGDRESDRDEQLLPALLYALRDADLVRTDYPLFVFDPDGSGDAICRPLADVLRDAIDAFAPGKEQARILQDNLPRVERSLRDAIAGRREAGARGPVAADELLAEVGERLQAELALGEESAARLRSDYASLLDAVPSGGELLALDEHTALRLLLAAARARCAPRLSAFRATVRQLRERLQAMLDVERAKDPRPREPEARGEAMSPSAFVDAGALAELVGPNRGSMPMDADRRRRIERVLAVLQEFLDRSPAPALTIVHDGQLDGSSRGDGTPFDEPTADLVASPEPCAGVAAWFDRAADDCAEIVRAVRTARLEIDGSYDPDLHDALLAELNWEAFSHDELRLVPPAVAIVSGDGLTGERMLAMSDLLRSGRPVQVLVVLDPGEYPGDDDRNLLASFRLELGFFGIGHREAIVRQSSPARPGHLVDGFVRALDATRTALSVVTAAVDADGAPPRLGAWLHASAALEARAHPIFGYDPEAGASWKSRFEFAGNPQPEEEWPVHALQCTDPDGSDASLSLAFTFADFALLERAYAGHFRVVPDRLPDDALEPLASYLRLDATEAEPRIPFVWAVDAAGKLRRVAVTRRMVQACRDRASFWRNLQELGGVHDEHALEAAERAREEARTRALAERAELESAHAEELARVRSEAAGEAMQGLAQLLLETDFSAGAPLPAGPVAAPSPPPAGGAAAADAATPETAAEDRPPVDEADEADDDVSFDEPWVDTPLCTSCDECVKLNPRVFVYDDDKQVVMGDPTAGSFAQLVEAAEKCPARCIHPGKPLDASEPGLDQLVERAAPFN